MNKLLIKLSHMLLKLAEINTNKGVLVCDGEIEEGKEVWTLDNNEEIVAIEDGEYETDTQIIKVIEGKVIEIIDKDNNEEVVPEPEPEPVPEPEPEPEPVPEPDEKDAKIAELEARIAELEAENAELKAQLEEASKKEEELQEQLKMSADTPLKDKEGKNKGYTPYLRQF